MTNVCTHINTDSGCLWKHIITAGVRKPNGECLLSPKHRDENQIRFCMPEASLTFSPDLVPSPWAEANCNPPHSDCGCESLAGGKHSSLTGVARFFKGGGNHRYRLFVPVPLNRKQINDVGEGLFGKKRRRCP